MIVFLSAAIGVGTWFVGFSGKIPRQGIVMVFYGLTVAFFIYSMYFQVKKLWHNEPVLILTSAGISIHEKGDPLSFLWWQVIHWEVEKDESNTLSDHTNS